MYQKTYQSMRFSPDHIALVVKDPVVSVKFYCELGGVVTSKSSDTFCELELGGQRFHLIKASNGSDASGRANGVLQKNLADARIDHVCLSVESEDQLKALCAKLQSLSNLFPNSENWLSLSPIQPPSFGENGHLEKIPPKWVVYFNDPDGISIEVRSY